MQTGLVHMYAHVWPWWLCSRTLGLAQRGWVPLRPFAGGYLPKPVLSLLRSEGTERDCKSVGSSYISDSKTFTPLFKVFQSSRTQWQLPKGNWNHSCIMPDTVSQEHASIYVEHACTHIFFFRFLPQKYKNQTKSPSNFLRLTQFLEQRDKSILACFSYHIQLQFKPIVCEKPWEIKASWLINTDVKNNSKNLYLIHMAEHLDCCHIPTWWQEQAVPWGQSRTGHPGRTLQWKKGQGNRGMFCSDHCDPK